jgi:transcriptional regulator with XRE-family HTH domain
MKPGMTDTAFLSQLKCLQMEQGLTQAELAKRARCSVLMISRYESQGAQPSARTMDRLKSALDFLASREGKGGGALRSIRLSFHLRPGVSVSFASGGSDAR